MVDKYSELKEKDYTADSWKGYQEAMDTAKKVLADEDATQEEVDAASTVLKNAVDKLVKVDEQKETRTKNHLIQIKIRIRKNRLKQGIQ